MTLTSESLDQGKKSWWHAPSFFVFSKPEVSKSIGSQVMVTSSFFSYLKERGQGQSSDPVHLVFNVFFLCYKFEVLVIKGTQVIA